MKLLYVLTILSLLVSKTLFAQELERVSLQLQWLNQFQFAGFYLAKERGYYKEVGLDVEIRPLKHTTNIINDIQKQKATYATARSSIVIEQSIHNDIIILDAIFEHSPSVLITTDPLLQEPHNLKNKKIMVTEDEALASSFYAMLASQGVHLNQIIRQEHSFDLEDLINGKTDAMASYISNEPFRLQERDIPYTILDPRSYGFDFYGDLLITSKQELQTHPERTKRFVEASRQGWMEAFKNIEATAQLIYEHYNEQNKSLEALIYEGTTLKSLWADNPQTGPHLDYKRFDNISKFYLYNHLITKEPDLKTLLDPLNFNRTTYTVGILANQDKKSTLQDWHAFLENINLELSHYNIIVAPLTYEKIDEAVKNKTIDFLFVNSMLYVQLEAKYGISPMVTLMHSTDSARTSNYGAVIFTRNDNKDVNTLSDLRNHTLGAVHPLSFGGWIMAKKEFSDKNIKEKDFKSLNFLQTHNNVVEAVLAKEVEVGIVRTGVLEALSRKGKINLADIKILHPQYYKNFPYLVSTPLYPEWSFAKMQHTDNEVAYALLSDLLNPKHHQDETFSSWGIPLTYKPVHDLLKQLQLAPYEFTPISYQTLFREYYFVIGLIIAIILFLLYFNRYLNGLVHKRTKALIEANMKLKSLAETDELTKISNRRHFMYLGERYFDIAKRNTAPLALLSLDIDYFKNINDTYGHAVGDEVLKLFTKTLEKYLRKSDIFGRLGGEEFSILLQNTTKENALILAEKLRASIEQAVYKTPQNEKIHFTVSIGLSMLKDEHQKLSDLLKSSDTALYRAKEQGRNRVESF